MKLLAAFLLCGFATAGTLNVYDIDVEGGKSVLLVSPSGESLLFDVGWPGFNGRDADRIVTAAKAAGLKQIDYLVVSHYDVDHMGDVPLLASKIPIKHILDHGPLQTSGKGAYQGHWNRGSSVGHWACQHETFTGKRTCQGRAGARSTDSREQAVVSWLS